MCIDVSWRDEKGNRQGVWLDNSPTTNIVPGIKLLIYTDKTKGIIGKVKRVMLARSPNKVWSLHVELEKVTKVGYYADVHKG